MKSRTAARTDRATGIFHEPETQGSGRRSGNITQRKYDEEQTLQCEVGFPEGAWLHRTPHDVTIIIIQVN